MSDRIDTVEVARRFRGPPASGNGGYVCGLLAEWVDGPCEVTLHAPTPLGQPLRRAREGQIVTLRDGDRLLATARPLDAPLGLEPPPPPGQGEIEAAARAFPDAASHLYPGCFVCGPERLPDDGLCIFTGISPARDAAVAEWVPAPDLAGDDGSVAVRMVWAALDCPSYFGLGDHRLDALLARMSARIIRPPRAGERLRVTGWPLGRDGRKHHAASALHDDAGNLVAVARALWIELRR